MSLADLEIFEDWGTLDDETDAKLAEVAKATLDQCRRRPSDPKVIVAALNHMYQEWKSVDEEQSTDAREAVSFIPSQFSRDNLGSTSEIPNIDYQSESLREKGDVVVKPDVKNSETVLKKFIDAIFAAVAKRPIAITGFGTFVILKFPSYKSVNPKTEEPIIVPEKRLLGIKFDSNYRRRF